MNFINSFLGSSSASNSMLKMDGIVNNRHQLLAAMPKSGQSNSSTNGPAQRAPAAEAAFLNSQLDGGTATSVAYNCTNHVTTSRSFYNEDRLLDPDCIDHLAEYSDTDEGPFNEWGSFGDDDDNDESTHLESGFTPENVFGPTEDDASSKATGINANLNLTKSSTTPTAEAKHPYQASPAEPASRQTQPTTPSTRSAPQKRKSFTLTKEPTMYIPDDMITIEAYMGPPANICPPPMCDNSHRRNSTGNMSKDYSESESSDSDDEDDTKKPAACSRDHADPFSKLAESSARTKSSRRYLEESRRMYSSIPDFHRYSNSKRTSSGLTNTVSASSLLEYSSDTNMIASFNSSGFSSFNSHSSNHNSTSSFHTSFDSSSSLTIPVKSPTSAEHQSRMSNLLTAMERALLRRRSEAAASASTVSASSISSLVMGRVGGPRKSRGASPPRSYQRIF